MKTSFLALVSLLGASPLSINAFAPPSASLRFSSKSVNVNSNSNKRRASSRSSLVMKDFPKPNLEDTDNYRFAERMSTSFGTKYKASPEQKKKVAIIGGGLSGLSCAKYLVDAGHEPMVYEARDVLGGKVSAWQDEDGDWIETGLHIFFGAYPNMMNMFAELDIHDRLQWKIHQMIFAMQELPGEFTSFNFIPGIPAPFNFGLAILMNQKMLTLAEKIQTAPPLIPMLIEGQPFIDAQDELSVTQFMKKYGMPDRINEEVFIAMAKALDFIDPDKLSMTVVLTAMNRFLNESNGLQMAFIDGNQPDRVCAPMRDHIEARGGKVMLNSPVKEIVTNEDGTVNHLLMRTGEKVVADEYISAMPVDIVRRMIPKRWANMPYFRQFDELEGIPVINLHMWFDRKLKAVDHLCFSRSPLLSVYADMSVTCKEYYDTEASMLELVFAPCSPLAGGNVNWISKSDEEIIDATMGELARLFPTEIAADDKWPATKNQGPSALARLRKFAVVKVPRSVYAAIPGRNKYRPSQTTPIPHVTMAGDWTSQKFLGSMEGAVLGGKLAAEVVANRAIGNPDAPIKEIQEHIIEKAATHVAKEPLGVKGEGAIAFGAGAVLSKKNKELLLEVDPSQFEPAQVA
uniref:Amine oxidase n=2 Tax=Attheya septentrionalis TaxID=420275 RepID=A0A7S2UKN1_9STRA|mmetsp:Transcript_29450/g.53943  ORF Transcript_29450/g.53943 Transcript_29450/m.53943 type:complete len:629 (+) Transcript_29450:178-2064(+)|eukprot:CAMPEP_0198303594 /NCGR_PEP_ID=MMETSP1449-20131203/56966_1 /TAXON_ID=420275 /ORGANISM="Attheya septentrionalis, Strain CCMP2084" /LENGTH=628 /DNA_ID=CAMNT_0044006089 /DNA_START=149 /DNA_END=2035 /DNA_ORIENTATION=-